MMVSTDAAGGMPGLVIPLGYCYGDEKGCDIIFLAGRDDDIWRLPAHKFLLTQSTPVFNAMLSPPFLTHETPLPHTIPIPDVDGKALDNLLRFLYNEPVTLQSVDTALLTLQASDKYICPGLARVCISYLSDNLNQYNALNILKYIRVYCRDYCREYQNLENLVKEREISDILITIGGDSKGRTKKSEENCLESATRLAEADLTTPEESIEMLCAVLLHKCLLVVDTHAEAILNSEELEDLDVSTVRQILERDTLHVKSEMLVFQALMRWADKECKRKQLPLTPISKRQVLGDESVFLPRYLIMSQSDFKGNGGPVQSEILNADELQFLLKIVEDVLPVMTKPNGPLQLDKVLELLERSPMVIPATLRPYMGKVGSPRKPLMRSSLSSLRHSQKKNKRPTLLHRWLCLKSCCKLMRHSNPSSPTGSNHSSPIRSCNRSNRPGPYSGSNNCQSQNSSSPIRCPASSGPSAVDVAIERLIICWAFFFD